MYFTAEDFRPRQDSKGGGKLLSLSMPNLITSILLLKVKGKKVKFSPLQASEALRVVRG
jgi:hypothetical protein